ncbi:type II toxin-antitoxin system RelE/ParE family toxin [Bradyrhizobium sp. WSM3983]|uniref:type II toxin-antitoxin system RelE/ParE family toxin n=1 Tax=Bradyrhizobium sp. WSM3983 TaxID=1038867 RepID=UPI00048361C0|nr:type II toxin-antitoxin system RelE/ParE family toxin [Bradyrhizobium sp. WSM3983]
MIEVRQTARFSAWLNRLKDANAVARIAARIRRMEMGNPGDSKSVGRNVREMRIDHGPGYRIYYVQRGAQIVILLCGGDKRTQRQDIEQAQKLAETV